MIHKNTYTALIIDDEENSRLFLGELLNRFFPEVHYEYASDVTEVLEYIQAGQFDLLFLDIVMPGINGLDFFELLKSKGLSPFVCIVSAHPVFEYAQQALQLGAFEYLLKPVSRSSLQKCMNRFTKEFHKSEPEEPELSKAPDPPQSLTLRLPYIEGNLLVSSDTIAIVEFADRNKINIMLSDGKQISCIFLSLKKLERTLPPHFLRISRKCIVNRKIIHSFNSKKRIIFLKYDHFELEVPCSRSTINYLRSL